MSDYNSELEEYPVLSSCEINRFSDVSGAMDERCG